MSWISLYIKYKEDGTVGKCPCCGAATVTAEHILNSITFSCGNCGKFKHYDELGTAENIQKNIVKE